MAIIITFAMLTEAVANFKKLNLNQIELYNKRNYKLQKDMIILFESIFNS